MNEKLTLYTFLTPICWQKNQNFILAHLLIVFMLVLLFPKYRLQW